MEGDELTTFLDRPLMAIVSTVSPSGAPHAVPVWYRYDGDRITVWTTTTRQWVKNVLADPRVAVTVAEGAPPFAAVTMRGQAEVVEDEDWVHAEIRAITARYMEADEVEAYCSAWPQLRTMFVLRPERVNAWGRGY